jgi:hypothetical protein
MILSDPGDQRPMPPPERANHTADPTIASGIESGIVLLLFVAGGYALDRWLGTRPVFTLGLFFVGAVGLFFRFKSQYTIRMDAIAEERRRPAVDRPTAEGPAS